ncbi:MAG: tRNA guanosine(34) transglycosylase Tgt [Turneriella sp.]|nr:tRNA guanosine(34) transglycosylase Tgt [Turneriella sp.]
MQFIVESCDGAARAGRLVLARAVVETPAFMPVGTQATIKAISQAELEEIGFRLILANTYHLSLRPGPDVLRKMGGIHTFMAWPHAVLTDSGGYQAFSLAHNVRLSAEGVYFRSHLDGKSHFFSPQSTIELERAIGADIIMPLDDCAPYPASAERLRAGLERTHRWLRECRRIWLEQPNNQVLFGIVQGGVDEKLRTESAQFVAELDLPGYAIGGLSVGEPIKYFVPALVAATAHLPASKPRYLMGVGSIPEILDAVAAGIDLFDCVLPTRNARNGQVFTSRGKINVRNPRHATSQDSLDNNCRCKVCQRYSLGYIRHLHKQREILGVMLTTYHNLYFMFHFMQALRSAIVSGRFSTFRRHWQKVFRDGLVGDD